MEVPRGHAVTGMTPAAGAGQPEYLWEPAPAVVEAARLTRLVNWLRETRGLDFSDSYESLWEWSVRSAPDFWSSIWEYFDVLAARPSTAVLTQRAMPGSVWFPGAMLNYAQHALRHARPLEPAIVHCSEGTEPDVVSWDRLTGEVGAFAATLRRLGVAPGDRVAGYLPNIPQAVVALLGCAAVSAVWSSCAPDFGTRSVIDRFQQIEPVVLVAATGYRFGGRAHDRRPVIGELRAALPTLRHTIAIGYPDAQEPRPAGAVRWEDAVADAQPPQFAQVPFDHPLWILFSSGTTGLPKGLVHGHGGIVLEQLKVLAFHHDLRPGDRFFWFTSTSWMMWNYLVGGLLHGATIVLYDGSPAWPGPDALWRLAGRCEITLLGTSAAYLLTSQKAGVRPHELADLRQLRTVGSTGSPLPAHAFRWAREVLGPDVPVHSGSGGTDVCSAFVTGNVTQPVVAGEIQCRALGVAVAAWNDDGRPVIGEVGELVVTEPMPSMPLYLWGDQDGSRYRAAYFDKYPGVWRHGDWITITDRHSALVHGRSDSTLNRYGVRLGTGELYRIVDVLPEVRDSLAIGLEDAGGGYQIVLFVVLAAGAALDDALASKIRAAIRGQASPRHVPDQIVAMPGVPHTLTGKKLEVPVKRLLQGVPVDQVANAGAIDRPELLTAYQEWAKGLPAGPLAQP